MRINIGSEKSKAVINRIARRLIFLAAKLNDRQKRAKAINTVIIGCKLKLIPRRMPAKRNLFCKTK